MIQFTPSLAVVVSCFAMTACASAETSSLADLFDRVDSAVVTVYTTSAVVTSQTPNVAVNVGGIGSGVLISKDGLILTAAHCVQTADEVLVEFVNGLSIPATVVASQPLADVAMIKLHRLPGPDIRPVTLGDSDLLRIGDEVFVIGAPLGMTHTLTAGHLSARRGASVLQGMIDVELLQTDAPINQGNSGGPLFNRAGEVMGIVSFIRTKTGGSNGLGFAVSANVARALLIDKRSFWSGLEGLVVRGQVARALNVPPGVEGYLVQRVARNSPAARLGIRAGTLPATIAGQEVLLGGDIILDVLGVPMEAEERGEIMQAVAALGVGDFLRVKVLRAGMQFDLELEMTKEMVVGEKGSERH